MVRTIVVEAGAEGARPVTLVLPDGYRADRAWPLVYALHPSGEPADRWVEQVRRMLGTRAREFVIASPEYRQNYIAVRPPFVAEHAAILDAVARLVHVDANRVYAFGYSKGGFAAWYVTVFFADRFAGTVALLRFPDTLTRLHALTKADNLGLGLVVLGLVLQAGSVAAAPQRTDRHSHG